MKFIKSILILIPLLLIGCSEIVNYDYADKVPTKQTLKDPWTWTLLRFNGSLTLLVDSVFVDIPNGVVVSYEGGADTYFPLKKGVKIHILEPISVGFKMVQDADTTAIDSVYIDATDEKVTKWTQAGMNSEFFQDITVSRKLYTRTY